MPAKHALNEALIEFFDRFASWEQTVVKGQSLSLPQGHTIGALGQLGPIPLKQLAERLGITMGTLTVQVKKLESLGLLARKVNEQDRRSQIVSLTEQGQKIFDHHEQAHQDLTSQLMTGLTEAEQAQLLDMMRKVNLAFPNAE